MDQINLTAWEGRTTTQTGGISSGQAAMIAATFSRAPTLREGDALPPLAHWCAFPPTASTSELGSDGHPRLGDFLPPVALDRRMWAGGRLTFHTLLHVGETLSRQSRIEAISEKIGSAGPMVFVTVHHEVFGQSGLAITETQDIVYLKIPAEFVPPRKIDVPQTPDLAEDVPMSPALLFRYSALTFNAHRIHYDLPYTRDVEHYPGLVVHGPLQATLLIDAAMRHVGRAPDRFSFRGVHPIFHQDDLRLLGVQETRRKMRLCTAAGGRHQGMQATADWEEETPND